MHHIQLPAPLYLHRGMKWSVMLNRTLSTSAVTRSSSRLSHGFPSHAFRSPIRIISKPFGAALSAYSTQYTADTSFGGTYTPTTYHRLSPDVRRKLTTLDLNMAVPSTCRPFAALQTTATPPRCQLSASVTQTSYPSPFRLCKTFIILVSCRNPTYTLPCCSSWSAISGRPTLPVRMFSNVILIPQPVYIPFQTRLSVVHTYLLPLSFAL